jgi:hypothetical protein
MAFRRGIYSKGKYGGKYTTGKRSYRTGKAKKTNKKISKGRKKTLKKSKSIVNSSYKEIYNKLVKDQLTVMQYPFSVATKYPKIPDGKCSHSIGLNFQLSSKIHNDSYPDIIFILFPGITDCLTVIAGNGQGSYNIISQGHFIQHCLPKFMTYTHGGGNDDDGDPIPETNTYNLDYTETGYNEYRYVSCGLRVGSDSTYLNNGGYWEAIRLPLHEISEYFSYNQAYETDMMFRVTPSTKFIKDIFKSNKTNPSLQTGNLATLGSYEFRLRPQVNEFNFTKIPRSVESDPVEVNEQGEKIDDTGFEGKHDQFNYICDKNFDIVALRVVKDTDHQHLTYHVSANVECTVQTGGVYSHFSQETMKSPSVVKNKLNAIRSLHRLPGIYNQNKKFKSFKKSHFKYQ